MAVRLELPKIKRGDALKALRAAAQIRLSAEALRRAWGSADAQWTPRSLSYCASKALRLVKSLDNLRSIMGHKAHA